MPSRKLETILELVSTELRGAQENFPPMRSVHEGYAIVLEEVRELEQEIFKSPKVRDSARVREEAIQVAAMAIRLLYDLGDFDA